MVTDALVVVEQLRRRVPGGVGTYVRGLVKGLESTDVAVTAWASTGRSVGDPLASLNVPVVTTALPSRLLTRAWDAGLMAPPKGYDVVHATSLVVPPRGSAPMTAMVHDLAWRAYPDAFPRRGRKWHEAALGRTVARCEKLFVPSRLTADYLIKGGVPAAHIFVVSEGCDHLPQPDHAGAEAALRGRDVTGPFLLAVGTLEPRKNLSSLIAAYESAVGRLPEPWPLVVVGPHGWGESFRPPKGVIAFGAPDPAMIAALYARCHLFVSVPLLEGYGLPVIEAMSMGAPVVASPVPSAGGATLEVDPNDAGAIADAIVVASLDESVRRELVLKGRRHAKATTWSASAAAHVEIWKAL